MTTAPTLSPLWRNALRTWLAATLAVGIMLWSGRSQVLMLALAMAVVFINENDITPVRSIGQMVGAALLGILTAVVLHQFSSAWPMLGLSLLATGALVRGLGLVKGLGMGYIGCWSLEVIGYGKHFNWALIFNLAFAVVVGIGMAQVATWVFWPRRPLEQLPQLEQGLSQRIAGQIALLRQWLRSGGPPPPALRSQELLPQILRLQDLHDQRRGLPTPSALDRLSGRWAQAGDIWRQLLRQWMLLEPLLLQLKAPLPLGPQERGLVISCLHSLEQSLLPDAAAAANDEPLRGDPAPWLAEADQLQQPRPLLLSIAQQSANLAALLQSRRLLITAIHRQRSARP